MSDKVKVVGYAKKVIFDGGIEYRNFNPDLVGVQLVSEGGTPLFTMGNFAITTNMEPKANKTFISSKFSDFYSLTNLDLTVEQSQTLLADNAVVNLNLDKTNLKYYALFGSLTEFIRISLEDIIIKWPASLYLTPTTQTSGGVQIFGDTYDNFSYDYLTEISSFRINTSFIVNNFQCNYLKNGTISDSFNSSNELRNITTNYLSYSILYDNIEFPLLSFTGSTYTTNDYIYLTVKGNPFNSLNSTGRVNFHIKPNKQNEEQFFNILPDFESYLLNRRITPKYTATFEYPIKSDGGGIFYTSKSLTWPTSDGYNIDFDTTNYENYAIDLIDLGNNNDLNYSNLMNRFLVSESISAFDTTPVHLSDMDQDTSGQKVNKTLQIYGVEFDKINNFITGIEFANTVTYNKLNNTPDIYLKNLASVLGWELMSSIMENNLLTNYVTTAPSQFSGETVGLTPVQADIELWRRIILNSPWLWKSKGARKSIEFLLRFIGAPQGLVKFNEHIYKAKSPIDVENFVKILGLLGLDTDLSLYPIDSNGYPNPLADTDSMYFQGNGLWYRETGGSGTTIDILTGNNPHVGQYDGGYKYMNQFRSLIPNFSAVTLSVSAETISYENMFINNEFGSYDESVLNSKVSAELTGMNGEDLSSCYVFTPSVLTDIVTDGVLYNDCGCVVNGNDNMASLCFKRQEAIVSACDPSLLSIKNNTSLGYYTFGYYLYNADGSIFTKYGEPIINYSIYTTKNCCKANKGTPALYDTASHSGYICCSNLDVCSCKIACDWVINESSPIVQIPNTSTAPKYLVFLKENGGLSVVTPSGSNCITTPLATFMVKVPNITDPFTGEVGVGCQLTQVGLDDLNGLVNDSEAYYHTLTGAHNLALGVGANPTKNSILYSTYIDRQIKQIGCCENEIKVYGRS